MHWESRGFLSPTLLQYLLYRGGTESGVSLRRACILMSFNRSLKTMKPDFLFIQKAAQLRVLIEEFGPFSVAILLTR